MILLCRQQQKSVQTSYQVISQTKNEPNPDSRCLRDLQNFCMVLRIPTYLLTKSKLGIQKKTLCPSLQIMRDSANSFDFKSQLKFNNNQNNRQRPDIIIRENKKLETSRHRTSFHIPNLIRRMFVLCQRKCEFLSMCVCHQFFSLCNVYFLS